MRIIEATIGGKRLKLALAETEEERVKGLSGTKKLKQNAGMLFVFDDEQDVEFNTADMNYTIDMLFFNEDWKVIRYELASPGDKLFKAKDTKYVLELNGGTLSVIEGIILEPDEDTLDLLEGKNVIIPGMEKFKSGGRITTKKGMVEANQDEMQVLDDLGTILMNIKGGERIFSRIHTDNLVKLAEKVSKGEANPKELGTMMKEYINIQDNQDPEYVYE